MKIIPDSESLPEEPESLLREVWSDAARASAAAARARRGAGPPTFAKPLGRGTQSRDKSIKTSFGYATPRSTKSLHYFDVKKKLDSKYSKHDVVNPSTGEVRNQKTSAHFKRFMRQVKRNAFKNTLSLRRSAKGR